MNEGLCRLSNGKAHNLVLNRNVLFRRSANFCQAGEQRQAATTARLLSMVLIRLTMIWSVKRGRRRWGKHPARPSTDGAPLKGGKKYPPRTLTNGAPLEARRQPQLALQLTRGQGADFAASCQSRTV